MKFIKALISLVAIPIFGFAVSNWVISDINASLKKEGSAHTIKQLCANADLLNQNVDLNAYCSDITPVFWMETASIISAIIAVVLLLSFIIFATVAGKSRKKITKIFPSLVFITLVIMAILVLAQGAILTYGAYVAESYFIQRVHFVLIAAIGFGALFGCVSLIRSSFRLAQKQVQMVLGQELEAANHPKLFKAIKDVADKLGARHPDHVIVGLEPNFFVTSADIHLVGKGKQLTGETLYLSLPLARILTTEEITGIIGHELGHFRGEDTYYSLKFSPVYSGLSHALSAMEASKNQDLTAAAATLPAVKVLSYILDVFHTNVSSISRAREFEADKAATEVASAESLANSLLKIGVYAEAWYNLEEKLVKRMTKGKGTRNASLLYASTVKYDVNQESVEENMKTVLEATIAHPTDSHPPTKNRIKELGLNAEEIEYKTLTVPESPCIELFEEPVKIEEELSVLQKDYYTTLGIQVENEEESTSASLIAAFGAHMTLADGSVEPEEIDEAESLGVKINSDFDYLEFREYCHYPETIPSIEELCDQAAEVSSEDRATIIEYLEKIASSDGKTSTEEKKLLKQIKSELK